MVTILIILETASICMIFAAMWLLLTGDGAREQKLMAYFLCGSLVQNVSYMLELTAGSMDVAIMATKIENLGSVFIPLCYCHFIYIYCYEKPPLKLFRILGGIAFMMLPIIFSCEMHGLFYRHFDWLETGYGHHYLSIEYGILYYPFLLTRVIIPYALSLYVLVRAVIFRPDNVANRQYKAILAISILPILALLAYIGKLTSVFDLTPLVLGISLSAVVILIWSRRNYDFRYLAADVVLNSMGDGVISLDEHMQLVSYNRAASNIFTKLGIYKIGESIHDLEGFQEEMLYEHASNKFGLNGRYYESHAQVIRDIGGRKQGYVILFLDITDTRNYINEIKLVRKQAEEANLAKSNFLANMSHEIRTPMNAIIGISDLIMEECQDTETGIRARNIQSAAQNLLAIINDILDLSKVEAGKMELILSDYYIKEMVDEVIAMMGIEASRQGILLKYEYGPAIPCQYNGDDGRIRQILINLLNNAIKFTKEGYVRMSIEGKQGEAENEELLIFQIEDTGCGIREEDQDKIFEHFKQVDARQNRSVQGTGLGLSIVKRLVELMDGTIRLQSVYGQGTIFTVTIPQKIVDARTLNEVPEVPQRGMEHVEYFSAPGVKVLVVDDNKINRKVASDFLKTYEFALTTATSGAEAIELVKNTKFDLIFMDHMMPEMDGIETVQTIRSECGENGSNPVIIALTATAMDGIREQFLQNGFQDLLTKPIIRRPLNDLLLRWIPENLRKASHFPEGFGSLESTQTREPPMPGEASMENIHIPGIDMEYAMQYYSGSLQDYQELLGLYCLDGERKTELLKELVWQENFKTYEIEVHGLKSASANIGAMALSTAAKEHEEAAIRGDTEYITNHFQKLLAAYEEQLENIQDYLDKLPSASKRAEPLPEIDRETLIQEAREALQQLENFHSKECLAQIEELLKYSLEKDAAARLREIRGRLKIYEDDEAELLLHRFIEQYAF